MYIYTVHVTYYCLPKYIKNLTERLNEKSETEKVYPVTDCGKIFQHLGKMFYYTETQNLFFVLVFEEKVRTKFIQGKQKSKRLGDGYKSVFPKPYYLALMLKQKSS